MPALFGDLRLALRTFARNRFFTFAAVFSLALGIGAAVTVFTLVNAVLLQQFPIADPENVIAVHTTDPRASGIFLLSYPDYKDYRDRNRVFSSLLLYAPVTMNLTGRGDPMMLMGHLVTGNYFSALGVNPVLGRSFLPDEDAAEGAAPVVVLSHQFWIRQFAGDPAITSRTISLGGRPYQVVGVAPPGFRGLNQLYAADVWVPMAMASHLFPLPAMLHQRRALMFSVAGRLQPGINPAQAEASLQTIAADLERQYPRDNPGRRIRLLPLSEAAIPARERRVALNGGTVLLIASALVMLIACGNVASLLLARAAVRGKEISIRLALGARRGHLIRQLLTESLLLGLMGGAAGLLLARVARDVVWSLRPPMFNRSDIQLDLDVNVLAFSLAASLLTGVIFGLLPALRSSRPELARDLKERTGRAAPGRWQLGNLLVSGQVAFCVVTLIGAGLFVRSVRNATRLDPGFDAARLGTVAFNVGDQGYSEARGREYQQRAREVAAATPGVISAAIARDFPLRVAGARTVLLTPGDPSSGRLTLTSIVHPGFFETIGIPLRRGRDFAAHDTHDAPRVAIVNEAAAAQFWPGADPVGKVLHFLGDNLPASVIGVVRTANYQAIGEAPRPMIYHSLNQFYFPSAVVYLRTNGDPDRISAEVRKRLQAIDRNLFLQSESFTTSIRESLWAQHLLGGLLGAFGILAIALSTLGIFGVISYSVNQRTREFGVRSALGATSRQIQTMVLTGGMRPVILGVVSGLLIGAGASRTVRAMLFISPYDAATFVLVPSILMLVGVLACWLPCRRAVRIDPMTALREE